MNEGRTFVNIHLFVFSFPWHREGQTENSVQGVRKARDSGTTKVRNSGLGPDPDLSAKSGPE